MIGDDIVFSSIGDEGFVGGISLGDSKTLDRGVLVD
jgi:hypothetical protein